MASQHDGHTVIPFALLVDLLSDEELERMEHRAWWAASAEWQRYQNALKGNVPMEELAILSSICWAADNWWRTVHEARTNRQCDSLPTGNDDATDMEPIVA